MKLDVPQLHDVDIRLLKVFKVVVECEGFAASEEALGVGRSTISKYIADIEARLGLRLCERGRSGFRISPHGQVVYRAALELLDSLERFRTQISYAKTRLSGELSVWLMDNTIEEEGNPAMRALSSFRARPGEVMLTINAAAPNAVEQAVASRRAHVGLTISCLKLPGLNYRAIGSECSSLYCGRNHPLYIAEAEEIRSMDVESYDFVTRGYLVGETTLAIQRRKSTALAMHLEAALQLILTGNYLGMLPDHVAQRWAVKGDLRKIPAAQFHNRMPINIVVREQSLDFPPVAALVEDLSSCYAAAEPSRALSGR
jgi:DNA-binding transcriptional LysR family regulator